MVGGLRYSACAVSDRSPRDLDADLLAAWQTGDERAGQELFRRRVGEITRFFLNKVPEPEVSDLVGQTFLGIVSGRERFRGETSFRRFAYSVAKNVLLEFIRKQYKRRREELDFAVVCVAVLAPRSPSSIITGRRETQALVDSLRHAPLDDQTLLEMRYFEAMGGREIAEALGISEAAARGKLARCTERLRSRVQAALMARDSSETEVSLDDLELWASQVRRAIGREEAG